MQVLGEAWQVLDGALERQKIGVWHISYTLFPCVMKRG